jgi:carbonic anhydrase
MANKQFGLIDNWLRHIKDVYRVHHEELDAIEDEHERGRLFVEVNVIEQVFDLCKTSIIQNSWSRRQKPEVHGWVYDLGNGRIKDLEVTVRDNHDMDKVYRFENLAISKKGIIS